MVTTDVEGSIVDTSEIQEFEINRTSHINDFGGEDEDENDNNEDLNSPYEYLRMASFFFFFFWEI